MDEAVIAFNRRLTADELKTLSGLLDRLQENVA